MTAIKSNNKLKTASVLAFERKLCNSDGVMLAGLWKDRDNSDNWLPVSLKEKDVRGTISNRLSEKEDVDPLKLNAEIQNANLQTVDVASLPFDKETLKVVFTLRVLGDVSLPTACNDSEYQCALQQKIDGYLQEQQCSELALRYAENLANGRFLWRNRLGAESVEVRVSNIENGIPKNVWIFNSLQYSLRNFNQHNSQDLKILGETIQQGLMGNSSVLLKIEAFVHLGHGQEVFPSQELVSKNDNKKDKNKKSPKSKVLYSLDDVAALHSQKIGNAIRTIDTWYKDADENGPIAIEMYGSVTNRGIAYRQPKNKDDFYSLLDNWIEKDKTPSIDQQHYVVACLIRGGVFGKKEKKKDKKRR